MSEAPSGSSRYTGPVCVPDDLTPAQIELKRVMRSLDEDDTLHGITHLGDDGVLRALDADRNVIDAIGIGPDLIRASNELTLKAAARHPDTVGASLAADERTMEEIYRGVDGTKVPREQWFNPPPNVSLPPPLEEEKRERDPEKLEERRRMYRERKAQREAYMRPSSTD